MRSALVTSEFPWQGVASVQRVPEGLLLVRRGPPGAIALPNEALSPDSSAFVLSSVAAAGGKVERER